MIPSRTARLRRSTHAPIRGSQFSSARSTSGARRMSSAWWCRCASSVRWHHQHVSPVAPCHVAAQRTHRNLSCSAVPSGSPKPCVCAAGSNRSSSAARCQAQCPCVPMLRTPGAPQWEQGQKAVTTPSGSGRGQTCTVLRCLVLCLRDEGNCPALGCSRGQGIGGLERLLVGGRRFLRDVGVVLAGDGDVLFRRRLQQPRRRLAGLRRAFAEPSEHDLADARLEL